VSFSAREKSLEVVGMRFSRL